MLLSSRVSGYWLIVLVGGFVFGGVVTPVISPSGRCSLRAQDGRIAPIVPDLKNQLEKGLKARLPREFEFIELVVGKVEANQLPLDLVTSTFLWARPKRPYPFPYFERGLRLRAAQRGIEL